MVLPVIAAVGRGLVQGAGTAVKGAANIAKNSATGVSQGARTLGQKSAGQVTKKQNESQDRPNTARLAQRPQHLPGAAKIAQRPPLLRQQARSLAEQHMQDGNQKSIGGNSLAGKNPLSSGHTQGSTKKSTSHKGALNPTNLPSGSQLGTQVIFSMFTASVGMFNPITALFLGTPLCFILWTNYIGWNLFTNIRMLFLKPLDGIQYPIGLLLFTFIYALQMLLLFVIVILIISLAQEILNFFPEPLKGFFINLF